METKEAIVDVLYDLVQINNDRIAGYERAIKETTDENADLKKLFTGFIADSRQFKTELGIEMKAMGEDMPADTSTTGKIYRAWMDVKAIFTGHNRHAILANCEAGEDNVQKAYREALNDEDMPQFLRKTISSQKAQLRAAHDAIKTMRDTA